MGDFFAPLPAESYPLVHGLSGGKPITLVNADTTAMKKTMGVPSQVLVSDSAMVGAHFDDWESIKPVRTFVRLSYLPEWVGFGLFDDQFEVDKTLVSFKTLAPPAWPVGPATIRLYGGAGIDGDSIRERRLYGNFTFEVALEGTLQPILMEWLHPLRDLLTLATGAPNVVTGLQFMLERDAPSPLIDVYYNVAPALQPKRKPYPHDMRFQYRDVSEQFGELVRAWFAVRPKLQVVCDLYFSTIASEASPTVKFLDLVRAIEVFDRLWNVNEVRPQAEHDVLLSELLAYIPEDRADDRDWLAEVLAYSNEPTLKARLTRLATWIEPLVTPAASMTGTAKFISIVTVTRHYLTHYDSKLRKRAASGPELMWLVAVLEVFVAGLLLKASGVDDQTLVEWFSRDRGYQSLSRA